MFRRLTAFCSSPSRIAKRRDVIWISGCPIVLTRGARKKGFQSPVSIGCKDTLISNLNPSVSHDTRRSLHDGIVKGHTVQSGSILPRSWHGRCISGVSYGSAVGVLAWHQWLAAYLFRSVIHIEIRQDLLDAYIYIQQQLNDKLTEQLKVDHPIIDIQRCIAFGGSAGATSCLCLVSAANSALTES